jgi:hypothetical protein
MDKAKRGFPLKAKLTSSPFCDRREAKQTPGKIHVEQVK